MAITAVDDVTTNLTNTNTTRTVNLPTHAAGDWVGVAIAQSAASGVTWTPPDDWEEIVDANDDTPASPYGLHIAWRRAPSGGLGSSVDFTASVACGLRATAVAYRGTRASQPVEAVSVVSVNGTSTAPDSPVVSSETDGAMICRVIGHDDDDNLTVPTGLNSRGIIQSPTPTNGSSIGWADLLQATAGDAGTAAWGIAAAEESITVSFALAEGPAVGTLEQWALWTVAQMRTDIAPGASGWDRLIEGTDMENIINDAQVIVGTPSEQLIPVRNLIVGRLINEVSPPADNLPDLESQLNAGQMNSSLIAIESFLVSSTDLDP